MQVEALQREVADKIKRIQELEVENKQQQFNRELLLELHARMERFEDTVVLIQTTL